MLRDQKLQSKEKKAKEEVEDKTSAGIEAPKQTSKPKPVSTSKKDGNNVTKSQKKVSKDNIPKETNKKPSGKTKNVREGRISPSRKSSASKVREQDDLSNQVTTGGKYE